MSDLPFALGTGKARNLTGILNKSAQRKVQQIAGKITFELTFFDINLPVALSILFLNRMGFN